MSALEGGGVSALKLAHAPKNGLGLTAIGIETDDVARSVLAIEGRTSAGPHAGWNYGDPARIMEEIAALTPSYSGVNYARLERGDRLQWPAGAR